MKILFLTASLKTPSARFRILQHLETWRELGFELEALPLPKGNRARLKLLLRLPAFDIVVLQKRLLHRHTLYLLHKRAKVLLYDFDDAVMFTDSNEGGNFISARRSSRFAAVAGWADLLIAGNDYLKDEAVKAGAERVEVVPTGVDCSHFRPRLEAPGSELNESATGPLTLGWIGSKANLVYLRELARPLNRLYEQRRDFRLNIVCDDFIDDFNCPVSKINWSAATEVADIQNFDIGLMPLADDPWTKGKCAFKLLQYMACGIPGVASRTAVTGEIITARENGCLAETPDEMVAEIEWLLDHRQSLPALGGRARISIMGIYDSRSVALSYAEIFKQVAG